MPPIHQVVIVEDWRPAAAQLDVLVEQLGHRTTTLPNLLDLVRHRVRRDRPDLIIFNTSTGLVGDHDEWRRLLSSLSASLMVVPRGVGPNIYEVVRRVGFSSFLDLPVSREKLDLAIHLAIRNRLAARTLERQIQRLVAVNERAGASGRQKRPKPALKAAAG
jgi:BMFP domain-containing protein YqiC